MLETSVMETAAQKQLSSRGKISTPHDARKFDVRAMNCEKIDRLNDRLSKRNNKTQFVICVPPKRDAKYVNTRYDMFQIGSPLSFHLKPVGFTTNITANTPELSMSSLTTVELPKLTLSFVIEENNIVPKELSFH